MHSERVPLPKGIRSVRLTAAGEGAAQPAAASPAELQPPLEASSAAPLTNAALGRIEELIKSLQLQLEDLEVRRRNSVREMQSAAVELAVAAAGQLLVRVIETHDYPIERIVQAAIDQMGLHRPISVRLHPDDLQLLRERMPTMTDWKLDAQCDVRPDPALKRGDCRADAPDGSGVLREAMTQLAEMRELWLEELDDAQVERRGHDGSGPDLKRFPERREIA